MVKNPYDDNNIPTLRVASSSDGFTPVNLWADPATHALVVSASVTLSKDAIPAAGLTQAVAVQIIDASGNMITSFGGGTQYAELATTAPGTGTLALGRYKASPPSLTDGQLYGLQLDSTGALKITGSISVGGTTDNSAFTAGAGSGTPAMGFFHSTIDAVTDGRAAALAIDAKRNLFTVLRDAAGNARGANVNASNQLSVSVDNTIVLGAGVAVIGHVITDSGSVVAATLSAETTKVIGVVRTADGSGNLLTSTTNALDVNLKTSSITLNVSAAQSGAPWTQDITKINGAAVVPATAGTNSTGAGILSVAGLAQFNDSTPTAITEGRFGNMRMSANRNAYMTIRDAAGNERGANVNTSSQLSVSVDNAIALGASAAVIGHVIVDSGAINATLSAETTKVIGTVNVAAGQTIAVTNTGTFAVQATLGAETTKVIGVVRTADGSGNLFSSNSTTFTAKFAQDINLLGTLGTAFSTAGKVDVKGADGDVFVRQATGTNLHMVVDSGTISTITNVVHVDDNAGSLTVDAPVGTPVFVRLSDGAANLIGQKAMATSLPVVLASDQASVPVAATLSAETTKVIGVTRTADGAGNLLTSNSSTFTAKFGLDINLLGTLGTAFSTAGKVDVKGADGDVFVRQATAANLNATVVGTGTFAVQNTPVAPPSIFNGVTNVTTAGSRVTLAASQAVQSVTIKAKSTNTGIIYVGSSAVSSANGFQLQAGEAISMDVANLNTVNLDCSVNGEGVTYIAVG